MKRLLPALLLFGLLLSSCCMGKFSDIKIKDASLESVNPIGLTALTAVANVEVDNPAPTFTLLNIHGVIKQDGVPCLTLTAEDVTVQGRTRAHYELPFAGALCDGFNPFTLLTVLKSKDLSAFTLDVAAHAQLKSGLGKDIEFKDLAVQSLLENL